MDQQNKYSFILLEDKQIFGLNKVHKNVLRPQNDLYNQVKSKVYYDPSKSSEADAMRINQNVLSFVIDGLDFDKQVVKTKAAYLLPYNQKETNKLFEDKTQISSEYKIKKRELKYGRITSAVKRTIREQREQEKLKLAVIFNEKSDGEIEIVGDALVKFKPKSLFSRSNENLSIKASSSHEDISKNQEKKLSKSLENLNEINEQNDEQDEEVEITPVFLTETTSDDYKNVVKDMNITAGTKKRAQSANKLKSLNEMNWDDQLIDMLSENTARWIVMKNTCDLKQKKKLNEMVDKKYGKFTRDIQDLELIEYGLTDYEKRKIAEEKERVKNETGKEQDKEVELKEEIFKPKTPVYRLPIGLKREAILKMKIPDSSFNKTAQNLFIESTHIDPPKTFEKKMLDSKLATSKTVLISDNMYTNRILEKNVLHKFKRDEKKIVLQDGSAFEKSLQPVFPIEFTQWISGVELVKQPKDKKPVKGKRRWTKLPEVIDTNDLRNPFDVNSKLDDYWNLMPTTTDTQLRKIVKSNLTVAKIVDEWRKKWQTSSKWTMAEIEELITDMKDPQANVRFQAVVICSRAVEQIQILINKFKKYHEKYPPKVDSDDDDDELNDKSLNTFSTEATKKSNTSQSDRSVSKRAKHKKKFITFNYEDTESLIYSAHLFETIESLLTDQNDKVKLASAITIFILLRYFKRPMIEKIQESKNKAESYLRSVLNGHNNANKYTAAQCMAIDGYCEEEIVRVLLKSYFTSSEQFTKEQVTKTLSELSADNEVVSKLLEEYLSSDHSRERILAAKLIPCLRRSITKEATQKLIHLMWNDMNQNVKKVAAQTLGRTGRGREVHNEILNRLNSSNVFDRLEALKKINFIGIMTTKMMSSYLKCFRDDHITIRELACKSSQRLWEKPEKLIESITFMAKFDQVSKLKALAIQTLGLIGEYNVEIRKCLLWALQFELDPLVRTEACHTLILLTKKPKDEEIIDILQERHLIEEEPIVRNELMTTLIHMGYNPSRELPILSKIKSDVAKFNDKKAIISKLKQIEKQLIFEFDKKRFIWEQQHQKQKDNLVKTKEEATLQEKEEINQDKEMSKSESIKKRTLKSMVKFQQRLRSIKEAKSTGSQSAASSSFLAKLVE